MKVRREKSPVSFKQWLGKSTAGTTESDIKSCRRFIRAVKKADITNEEICNLVDCVGWSDYVASTACYLEGVLDNI